LARAPPKLDLAGGAYCAPDLLAGLRGTLLLRGWKVSGGEGPDWAPVAPLFWPTLYNLLILFLFYVPNKSIEFF